MRDYLRERLLIAPEESRHLIEGPRAGETAGGAGLVEVLAVADPGDGGAVLDRCREVLLVVLDVGGSDWPAREEWERKLPHWFVAGCADETSTEQDARWLAWWRGLDEEARELAARERPWSLADWLHWLQPEERQWFWWDGVVQEAAADEVRVLVEVPGWPAPLGALEWLLRVAGARFVQIP